MLKLAPLRAAALEHAIVVAHFHIKQIMIGAFTDLICKSAALLRPVPMPRFLNLNLNKNKNKLQEAEAKVSIRKGMCGVRVQDQSLTLNV